MFSMDHIHFNPLHDTQTLLLLRTEDRYGRFTHENLVLSIIMNT
jgi:hypothetical protein